MSLEPTVREAYCTSCRMGFSSVLDPAVCPTCHKEATMPRLAELDWDTITSLGAQRMASRDLKPVNQIPPGMVTMGVGDGGGQLFVHGTYESIKRCQELIAGRRYLVDDETLAALDRMVAHSGDGASITTTLRTEDIRLVRAYLRRVRRG